CPDSSQRRRGGDSNPRWTDTPIPVFETGAFNRSATSPGAAITVDESKLGAAGEGARAPLATRRVGGSAASRWAASRWVARAHGTETDANGREPQSRAPTGA